MRKVSMRARDELVNALARRYAVSGRAEKARILDEFVAITGFHRKHAMRLLSCETAITGQPISPATAFSDRDISVTSFVRFSACEAVHIICR